MPLSMMSRGDWVMNTTAPFRLRIVRSCFSMIPAEGRIDQRPPALVAWDQERRAVKQQRYPMIEIGQRRASGACVLQQRRRVEAVQIPEPDGVDRRVDDPAELVAVTPLVEPKARPFRFVVKESAQFTKPTVLGRQLHDRGQTDRKAAAFFLGHVAANAAADQVGSETRCCAVWPRAPSTAQSAAPLLRVPHSLRPGDGSTGPSRACGRVPRYGHAPLSSRSGTPPRWFCPSGRGNDRPTLPEKRRR